MTRNIKKICHKRHESEIFKLKDNSQRKKKKKIYRWFGSSLDKFDLHDPKQDSIRHPSF